MTPMIPDGLLELKVLQRRQFHITLGLFGIVAIALGGGFLVNRLDLDRLEQQVHDLQR